MLLQNYYRYMRVLMMNTTENYITTTGEEAGYNRTQATASGAYGFLSAMTGFSVQSGYGLGVNVGTGSRKPAYDDYCLESPITSGLTVTKPNGVSITETSEFVEYAVTFGVKANDTVTISEMGLICHVYYSSSSSCAVMMERTVLDNPITINANETKQITYTIRFNYPVS